MSIFPISVTSKKDFLAAMERSNTIDSALSVEDVTASDAEVVRIARSEAVTPRPSEVTGDCDWSEHAAPDSHLWQPSASGVEVSVVTSIMCNKTRTRADVCPSRRFATWVRTAPWVWAR